MIDPTLPAGEAGAVATDLPSFPEALAFDGSRLWTANNDGSVSIITPGPTIPWSVSTVTSGFQFPSDIGFDGQHIWVTDTGPCALLKLDATAAVQQTVSLGMAGCNIKSPAFDGSNLLVPNKVWGCKLSGLRMAL